jgi:hypothetical protein
LLVIEVKEPSEALSEDDRDQAISYAKLLHPVTPFALVTNRRPTLHLRFLSLISLAIPLS